MAGPGSHRVRGRSSHPRRAGADRPRSVTPWRYASWPCGEGRSEHDAGRAVRDDQLAWLPEEMHRIATGQTGCPNGQKFAAMRSARDRDIEREHVVGDRVGVDDERRVRAIGERCNGLHTVIRSRATTRCRTERDASATRMGPGSARGHATVIRRAPGTPMTRIRAVLASEIRHIRAVVCKGSRRQRRSCSSPRSRADDGARLHGA